MKLDLSGYENLTLDRDKAYAKAASLLGIDPGQDMEESVNEYIDRNYQLYRNDEEYQYMGYDCGDCYMGGDVKKGIACGDLLVVYVRRPGFKRVYIYQKKS